MQSRLIPIDGEVRSPEFEFFGGAGQRAAAAEAVPRTPGAPTAAPLNHLQNERVFVAQAVITENAQKDFVNTQ